MSKNGEHECGLVEVYGDRRPGEVLQTANTNNSSGTTDRGGS